MVAMANFLAGKLKLITTLFNDNLSRTSKTTKEQESKIKRAAKRGFPLVFTRANAEHTNLPGETFDLVTVMFAFHEAPKAGRDKILREARRLLHPGGTLAVVDIATDNKPSKSMLSGEPFILEYQRNIHRQLSQFKGFMHREFRTLVPGHVGMWTLKRSPISWA